MISSPPRATTSCTRLTATDGSRALEWMGTGGRAGLCSLGRGEERGGPGRGGALLHGPAFQGLRRGGPAAGHPRELPRYGGGPERAWLVPGGGVGGEGGREGAGRGAGADPRGEGRAGA